jgi:ubiquinone/menaquinone biosynthesis C-methylase UbiE
LKKQSNLSRTTNKKILVRNQYKNQSKLMLRKKYNSFMKPLISIDKEIIKLVKNMQPSSILDVGCGNGDLLIGIRKSHYNKLLTGIDLSKGMLKSGIEENKKRKLNINFICGDAEKLPFDSSTFDLIISKHMLYHLPNPKKAINEMHRCLKQNGHLIITLNAKGDEPQIYNCEKMICKKYNLVCKHGNRIANENTVRKMLQKFSITNIKYNESKISKPQMFPSIIESFRSDYEPQPKNVLWCKIMDDVNNYVKIQVAKKGKFVEKRIRVMIICKKN